jgi:hypothetical protein
MVLRYYRRWQKQKRGVDKPHFGELRALKGFLLPAAAGSMHTTNIHRLGIVVFRQSTLSFL